ncbi:uncharacterized protein LOC143285900 [Babylonia areolata]|uniref:uncharacterized protein LOC143285900 n=1 Tax=Babylonia areolata TaxID=304850 RepID=UPI003FD2EBAC
MGDPSWLTTAPKTEKTTAPRFSLANPCFKVILIGEAGVGKTSIFSRARQPEHVWSGAQTSASIRVDTCTRTICTQSGDVTLTLWDTAGAEKYRTLTRNYYRDTHAVLLVFSVDDPPSLHSLPGWQRDVTQSSPSVISFLVGNKSDLTHQVSEQCMRAFADSHNCQAAFLLSAKTGEGVESALSTVCQHLVSQSHHRSRMHNRDRLWLEGSGVHIHGCRTGQEGGSKCCS